MDDSSVSETFSRELHCWLALEDKLPRGKGQGGGSGEGAIKLIGKVVSFREWSASQTPDGTDSKQTRSSFSCIPVSTPPPHL